MAVYSLCEGAMILAPEQFDMFNNVICQWWRKPSRLFNQHAQWRKRRNVLAEGSPEEDTFIWEPATRCCSCWRGLCCCCCCTVSPTFNATIAMIRVCWRRAFGTPYATVTLASLSLTALWYVYRFDLTLCAVLCHVWWCRWLRDKVAAVGSSFGSADTDEESQQQ